jgi:hypothetical protein
MPVFCCVQELTKQQESSGEQNALLTHSVNRLQRDNVVLEAKNVDLQRQVNELKTELTALQEQLYLQEATLAFGQVGSTLEGVIVDRVFAEDAKQPLWRHKRGHIKLRDILNRSEKKELNTAEQSALDAVRVDMGTHFTNLWELVTPLAAASSERVSVAHPTLAEFTKAQLSGAVPHVFPPALCPAIASMIEMLHSLRPTSFAATATATT